MDAGFPVFHVRKVHGLQSAVVAHTRKGRYKLKSPVMPLFVNNWLGSHRISMMNPAQEGAFFRLLLHQWQSEDCSLPMDDDSLAMLSRLGSDWQKNSNKIKSCFLEVEGRYRNERCYHEWKKRKEWLDSCSKGGKKSAEIRWKDDAPEETESDDNAPEKPLWKTSFEEYQKQETEAFNAIYNDKAWIKQQQELNPILDIQLTLKKAHLNFWSTKAGWKNKKASRTLDIDWNATFINALSMTMNKTHKPRMSNEEQVNKDRLDADNRLRESKRQEQVRVQTWESELGKAVKMMKANPDDYPGIKAKCIEQDSILGKCSNMLLSEALEEWWKEFQSDIKPEANDNLNF